jgi:hypothetical protein
MHDTGLLGVPLPPILGPVEWFKFGVTLDLAAALESEPLAGPFNKGSDPGRHFVGLLNRAAVLGW